jgi:hypothetical protein
MVASQRGCAGVSESWIGFATKESLVDLLAEAGFVAAEEDAADLLARAGGDVTVLDALVRRG